MLLLPAGRGDHGGREGHGDAEHLEDEGAPRDGEGVEEAGGRRVGDLWGGIQYIDILGMSPILSRVTFEVLINI